MTARKANYEIMNHEARRRIFEPPHRKKQLDRIYKRDNGICQICYKPCLRSDASRDHIKEFWRCTPQEARSDDNMQLAHVLCNLGKARSLPKNGKLPQQRKPSVIDSRAPRVPLTYKIEEAFPDFPHESD